MKYTKMNLICDELLLICISICFERWKTMEHHDVVVECAKLSVFTKDEVSMPYFAVNRPRDSDLKRFIGTQNVFGKFKYYFVSSSYFY